jgi:oxygen-dependent protoporphyrinogen oxidase
VRVEGSAPALEADAIVLATDCAEAARLLREHAENAADLLAGITCPPVTVVALGYQGSANQIGLPRGFGVLVPRGESVRMLGCLWDSQIFPARAPAGHLLVRAMLGGAVDAAAGSLSESEAIACVREDLRRLFGVDAMPCFEQVVRWPAAIPQYELGHLDRVRRIEDEVARLGGVFLAGNALHGVAFAKAAACGWAKGNEAARWALEHHDGPQPVRPALASSYR